MKSESTFKNILKYISIGLAFILLLFISVFLVFDLFENEPVIFTSPMIEPIENYNNEHLLKLDTLTDSISISK